MNTQNRLRGSKRLLYMEIHCDQLTTQHWIKGSQNCNFSMHSYEKVKLAVWIRFFDINSRRSDFYWPSNYNRRSPAVLKRWFGLGKCENVLFMNLFVNSLEFSTWSLPESHWPIYLNFREFQLQVCLLRNSEGFTSNGRGFFDFKSKLKITVVPAIALLILPAFLKSFYFIFLNRKAIKWMII